MIHNSFRFTPASDKVEERGRMLLEQEDTDKSFETDKKSRRWYRACMNETRIEELGVQPLLDTLEKLGGWPVLEKNEKSYESFKWYEQVSKLNSEGLSLNYIMSHYIDTDDKNNSYRVIKLDQSSLGLSREYLIKGFEDKDVQSYYQYMIDSAVLLGADETKAKSQLKDALMFEISLANLSAPREERRDANKLYNPTTLGDLDSEANKVAEPAHPPSWQEYIAGLVNDGIHYKYEKETAQPGGIVSNCLWICLY
jgi:predicted metalloendopeptidase